MARYWTETKCQFLEFWGDFPVPFYWSTKRNQFSTKWRFSDFNPSTSSKATCCCPSHFIRIFSTNNIYLVGQLLALSSSDIRTYQRSIDEVIIDVSLLNFSEAVTFHVSSFCIYSIFCQARVSWLMGLDVKTKKMFVWFRILVWICIKLKSILFGPGFLTPLEQRTAVRCRTVEARRNIKTMKNKSRL